MITDYSNIFQLVEQENGDIILTKKIIDINMYDIEEHDDNIILKKRKINVNINDLKQYNFKKSLILECYIDGEKMKKNKYKPILIYVYNKINDGSKIIKNTKLKIITTKKQIEGFRYYKNLGISVQGINGKNCLFEILYQCKLNNINIQMKIKLQDDLIVIIEFTK